MSSYFKLIIFFIFFQISGKPQSEVVLFEYYSLEQGLSQNTVYNVLQDTQGFIWLATSDGLNRYDGFQFKVYRNDPNDSTSLSANRIYALLEDSYKNLWIGTYGGGLNKYDRETESFIHYRNDPQNHTSLSDDEILTIYEDRSHVLWVGTDGGGLNKFDRDREQFKNFRNNPHDKSSLSDDEVQSIFEDHLGYLWIGTKRGGLNKFDIKKERFVHYKNNPGNPSSLSDDEILSIYEDKFGNLWVGTGNGGLNRFNRSKESFIRYLYNSNNPNGISANRVYSILEDKSGNLWIGTMGGGLNKYNRDHDQFISYTSDANNSSSLSSSGIFSLFEDRAGILWIGTYGGGVNKLDQSKQQFKLYRSNSKNEYSLSDNGIFAICEDRFGDIWLGTNYGLNKFDRKTKKFSVYRNNPSDPMSISDDEILSIYEDKSGNLWIGTYGEGLNLFDRKRNQFIHFKKKPDDSNSLSDNEIFSISEDSAGYLWIGTYKGGLNRYDREKNQFISYKHDPNDLESLSVDRIFSIYEDKNGNLWIGTDSGGLNKFDRKGNKFIAYKHDPNDPKSISNDAILSIYESKSGDLWIGTHGGGLNKFNRNKEEFEHFRMTNGLPNDVVYGILEDEIGNLWLSTNKGISRFNVKTKTFRNYDASDGLQGNEFNQGAYCKSKSGEMIFGGPNGLNIFYPDSIKSNTQIPQIVITDFQLQHKPVSIGFDSLWDRTILEKSISESELIELNNDDNVISFEFVSLDFKNPEKNKYAYIMQGFDKDWNFTSASHRIVTYTNLDPGEYIFKVKASNNDGVWNEAGTSLIIKIKPPWWATWWSLSLYGFVLLLISVFIRQYDLKRQRLKHQLELEHEHAKKLEEVDQMKSRFFANISHEFRTPLTLILGPAEKIILNSSDENLNHQAGLIRRNANRLLTLINQLLELSKLEAGKLKLEATPGNIALFVRGVAMTFESIAEKKDITFNVFLEKENIETYFDKDKVEQILVNIMSNAFKFTKNGGKITVSMKEKEGNLVEISVRDTGVGIPKNELHKTFDRFYQVDGSHTREHEGTGIGLALTKELVELHKGEIKIDSVEGEWTEVKITLPLGLDHLSEGNLAEDSKEVKELVHFENEYSERIPPEITFDNDHSDDRTIVLIVEDNSEVRDYIKDSIGKDYHIEEAINGEQGLRKAEKIIPDLIVSDIMMPQMDGFEMTRRIKNEEKTCHIPIILLTSKSGEESKLEGLELGADAFLTKPFSMKELQVRIKSLIELRNKLQEKFSKGEFLVKPEETKISKMDEKYLNKIIDVVNLHLSEEEFSIEEIGDEIGMSRSQVYRKLKALTGKSPSLFLRSVRLNKAKQMISNKEASISEISYQVGFSSPAYFSRCFKEEFGTPPSEIVI